MTHTHTEAELPVPLAVLDYIKSELQSAGYHDHLNHDGTISMDGLALAGDAEHLLPELEDAERTIAELTQKAADAAQAAAIANGEVTMLTSRIASLEYAQSLPSQEHQQLWEMLGVTNQSEAAARIGLLLGIALKHNEGPYAPGTPE